MQLKSSQKEKLKKLPGVDHLLELADRDAYFQSIPRSVLTRSIRSVLDDLRKAIIDTGSEIHETRLSDTGVLEKVRETTFQAMTPNLQPLVNATGVVIHTNLGVVNRKLGDLKSAEKHFREAMAHSHQSREDTDA